MRRPWLVCSLVLACGGAQLPPARVHLDAPAAPRCAVADSTGRLLASMKQHVSIDAYVTRGRPNLDSFVRHLEELLQAYKDAGGGKLDYTVIEPKDNEGKKKNAEDDGLKAVDLGKDGEVGGPRGYMGLVIHYGAEKDALAFLSPGLDRGIEYWIADKLRELRDKGEHIEHRIGILAGHDELKLSDANLVPTERGKPSMLDVMTRNFPMYAFVAVDLNAGERAVDDGLEALLVTQPGKDLSEKELRRIDEFVMKGKSLAVFASAVNVKASDPTMSATLGAHGLDKLLDGYGIELRKDVVLDFENAFKVSMLVQGTPTGVTFPQIPNVRSYSGLEGDAQLLDESFAPFFRLGELNLPFASSLVLHKDRQPGATAMAVVARSSAQALRKTGDTVDLSPFQLWRPSGAWEQFNLAVDVEGRLQSAFPVGDKLGVDAAGVVPEGKQARVFVVASSQLTANPFARAGNGPAGDQRISAPLGGDEKLLQIAGPYADLAGGAVPILFPIIVLRNTLQWMVDEPALSGLAGRVACGGSWGK